jgi:hypothetical protein
MASIGNHEDLGIKLESVSDPTDLASCITAIETLIDRLEACGILTPD